MIRKTYYFYRRNYNSDGFDLRNNNDLFIEFIYRCEYDFASEFKPLFANFLYANQNTFSLLRSCFMGDDDEIFGMENVTNGNILEINLRMDEVSRQKTVYALGSGIRNREDEEIFLVRDNDIKDNEFILSFRPDFDEGDDNTFVSMPIDLIKNLN